MKRTIAVILWISVMAVCFTGCSSKTTGKAESLKEGVKLQEIADKVAQQMQMPGEPDEQMLSEMGFDPSLCEDYGVQIAMVNTSADRFFIAKPKEGEKSSVQAALERVHDRVKMDFEKYLPDQKEKADKGKIYAKGNYLVLLVVEDMEAGEKAVNSFFE